MKNHERLIVIVKKMKTKDIRKKCSCMKTNKTRTNGPYEPINLQIKKRQPAKIKAYYFVFYESFCAQLHCQVIGNTNGYNNELQSERVTEGARERQEFIEEPLSRKMVLERGNYGKGRGILTSGAQRISPLSFLGQVIHYTSQTWIYVYTGWIRRANHYYPVVLSP